MNVLVVHDFGPLGHVLLELLRQTPLQVRSLLVSEPERVDQTALQSWVPDDTDLIVNALWLTDPQWAEADPERCRHAAFSLPVGLAEYARSRNMAMFQLSSCYVFDGRKQSAYITSNPGNPFSELGKWQWECEQALRARLSHHVLLRTGWSLARFLQKLQHSAGAGSTLSLSGKHRGQPVSFRDLARVMVAVIQQLDCGAEAWGTYQYAGTEAVSQYDLGLALLELPELTDAAKVIDQLPEWSALELKNATLGCTKIRNTFGIKQMPWRRDMADELKALQLDASGETWSSPGASQPNSSSAGRP